MRDQVYAPAPFRAQRRCLMGDLAETSDLDPVRRWQAADLAELVPGTSVAEWRRTLAPRLVAARALRRHGQGWFGRRSAIEAALVSDTPAEDADARRWRADDLAALVPGTSAVAWRRTLAPQLVAMGVLQRRGRGWFGLRSAIEAALVGTTSNGSEASTAPTPEPRGGPRRHTA